MLVSLSARLHHLHFQRLGLVPPALVPVRRRQVGHAGQRDRAGRQTSHAAIELGLAKI